jgi:hypothetical protein
VASPMPQIRRIGYPHMSAKRRHRTMDERLAATNPAWQ